MGHGVLNVDLPDGSQDEANNMVGETWGIMRTLEDEYEQTDEGVWKSRRPTQNKAEGAETVACQYLRQGIYACWVGAFEGVCKYNPKAKPGEISHCWAQLLTQIRTNEIGALSE